MTSATGLTTKAMRRSLYSVFAAAVGGASVAALTGLFVPSATAAPDPCAASEVAKTVGAVATAAGSYLDSHPETNQALTTISKQQAGPQSLGALKAYFDANPQAGDTGCRRPRHRAACATDSGVGDDPGDRPAARSGDDHHPVARMPLP